MFVIAKDFTFAHKLHIFTLAITNYLWNWRRLLRVPWTARRTTQSYLKEISPGCSLEGLMLKLKLPILWPPDAKSWLIWKDPDAGKDWGQEKKGTTKDEMVGLHHRHNGHGFGWTPGVDDGQGGRVCWGSWGRKESDTTERLNWIELKLPLFHWKIPITSFPQLILELFCPGHVLILSILVPYRG